MSGSPSLYRLVSLTQLAGTWHRASEPYNADKVHENIKYTEEDDKAIDDWIADHVETTWHSLGTCGPSLSSLP